MTNKVRELRKLMPIPVGEALLLLKNNNGDIDLCTKIFKEKSIQNICQLTGCCADMAAKYYEREKYDLNRTVSMIQDDIYDQSYKAIDGLSPEKIRFAIQWLNMVEDKDFATSLDYKFFDEVVETFSLIAELNKFGEAIAKAKELKDVIFEGYTDDESLNEFVRRHKRLDDEPVFHEADQMTRLSKTVIKDELLKHLRNTTHI